MMFKGLILFLIMAYSLESAPKPYWVFLEKGNPVESVMLTPRAEVRIKNRGKNERSGDQPISEHHLAQIRAAGFPIRHASRFLHAVSVLVENPEKLQTLRALPIVRAIRPVARYPLDRKESTAHNETLHKCASNDYGPSITQNEMLNIPLIHNRDYDGSGVLVAVFDTGFLLDHPVFDALEVQAQYDFIDNESDASGLGHEHGINVLSVLAGYHPGKLIGPAYGATYLLARTEDDYSESRAEEDNWVAALEWADSLGVDVVNSSLNYFDEFDDPNENYPPSALDGQTTLCAQAANIAAQRGILIVNSAGNEGPGASSLWPPADSPNVLAVGSVNQQNSISYFSGRGPTFDGRIKPDVTALGSTVYMATGVNGYTYGNGTSFSAPQIAGLAALLLQADPYLSPDSIISIFKQSGEKADSPDNDHGWGIPDLTGYFREQSKSSAKNCLVYPNPGRAGEIRMVLPEPISEPPDFATLYDIRGRVLLSLNIDLEAGHLVKVTIPSTIELADQLVILSMRTSTQTYAGKLVLLK